MSPHLLSFGSKLTIVITIALLAPIALPNAVAQPTGAASPVAALGPGRAVGVFDVTPVRGSNAAEGQATGSVVSTIVAEAGAQGGSGAVSVLRNYAVSSGGSGSATVFDAVDIQGFDPTSKLEGVGTSTLSLRANGLVMRLTDAKASLLMMEATSAKDQVVTFRAPDSITIAKDAAVDNVYRVSGGAGAVQGAIVILQADQAASGKGASTVVLNGQHTAQATLKQGAQIVFRADTSYASDAAASAGEGVEAYNRVVVATMASGKLVGEATTEFSSGAQLIASAQYHAFAQARTEARETARVTTTLKTAANVAGQACATTTASGGAAAGASAQACARAEVLAYDVDYVDVPARTAEDVAVYIDGALAQRVSAASEVATHADSYWAWTVDGRVLVVTNVAAKANAATQVTIAALAQGQAAASTLTELDASSAITAQIEGGYSLLGNLETSAAGSAQVIGSFSSFFASEAKGQASVSHFTDIRSAEEIFTQIQIVTDIAGDATTSFASSAKAASSAYATESTSAAAGAAVTMTTTVAGNLATTTTFTDSVYSSIETTADVAAVEDFHLSNDISAHALADAANVVELDGPAGKVGYLIIEKAAAGADTHQGFDLSKAQNVKAHLEAGEKLVFRGAASAQARASAELIAKAIQSGSLASESTVGLVANAISSASIDYRPHVHAAIASAAAATHRGVVTLDVAADTTNQAEAMVVSLIADRATLTAQEANDIAVTVNGRAAVAATSAADVLAAANAGSTQATYFVTAGLAGQTQVLANLPALAPGQTSRVVVTSLADARARVNAALDVFSEFQPGYGGASTGGIVSLVAKLDAGLVLDYTVNARSHAAAVEGTSTKVFDVVRLGTSALAAPSSSSASSLKFQNAQGTIEAFDVSEAVLKVAAKTQTAAMFDVASHVTATPLDSNIVMLSAPDFSSALIVVQSAVSGAGASTLDTSLVSRGIVTAQLAPGAEVIFKAFSGFEAELSDAEKVAQAHAIASGELIGQVLVRTDPATRLTSTTSVNYLANPMTSTSVATPEKVEVLVDSATHAGRSIIISVDRNTVPGLLKGDAKLMIDGTVIAQAASYADALNPNVDKYWLITSEGEAGLQAIVTLSHFSTRSVTLETPPHASILLWTTMGLGAVVIGQAVYPWLRRKK